MVTRKDARISVTTNADINSDLYNDSNLLVYGIPISNTFLAKYNNKLPQRFVIGKNSLDSRPPGVKIHLTSDSDIGVVETIPLDNPISHAMTVISGTTPLGVSYIVDNLSLVFTNDVANLFYINGNNEVFSSRAIISSNEENQNKISNSVLTSTPTIAAKKSPTETPIYQLTMVPGNSQNNSTSHFDYVYLVLVGSSLVIIYSIFQLRKRS